MNLNRPAIGHGPLAETELDRSPAPRIPRGCDYQGRYPEAAECCTDIGADDESRKSFADAALDWLTPRRFWTLYATAIVVAMLSVWLSVA